MWNRKEKHVSRVINITGLQSLNLYFKGQWAVLLMWDVRHEIHCVAVSKLLVSNKRLNCWNLTSVSSQVQSMLKILWSPKAQEQHVCIYYQYWYHVQLKHKRFSNTEWNVRIVTSLRVNTRCLAIQTLLKIEVFHGQLGITGNQLPICDSVSPSKQLQRCSHSFNPYASSLSPMHGLKERLAVWPAAASKSFTQTNSPHAPTSTWPLRLSEQRFGSISCLNGWHSSVEHVSDTKRAAVAAMWMFWNNKLYLILSKRGQASSCSKLLGDSCYGTNLSLVNAWTHDFVLQSVHHCGPPWNISTATGLIAMKVCTDIQFKITFLAFLFLSVS